MKTRPKRPGCMAANRHVRQTSAIRYCLIEVAACEACNGLAVEAVLCQLQDRSVLGSRQISKYADPRHALHGLSAPLGYT